MRHQPVLDRTHLTLIPLVALALAPACGGSGSGRTSALAPAEAAHVLGRAGYGGDPWSEARLAELGLEGYVDEQLHPELVEEPEVDLLLAGLESLTLSLGELIETYQLPPPGSDEPVRPDRSPATPLRQLGVAKLIRATEGRRQLEAVLVDFWFDHFNVFGPDGLTGSRPRSTSGTRSAPTSWAGSRFSSRPPPGPPRCCTTSTTR